MTLQGRLAQLVKRPHLDKLYLGNVVSPEEYIEILIGSGWTHEEAQAQLLATHDAAAPEHWTRPEHKEPAYDWSRIGKPGRKPAKACKDDNCTTGHPLEE